MEGEGPPAVLGADPHLGVLDSRVLELRHPEKAAFMRGALRKFVANCLAWPPLQSPAVKKTFF